MWSSLAVESERISELMYEVAELLFPVSCVIFPGFYQSLCQQIGSCRLGIFSMDNVVWQTPFYCRLESLLLPKSCRVPCMLTRCLRRFTTVALQFSMKQGLCESRPLVCRHFLGDFHVFWEIERQFSVGHCFSSVLWSNIWWECCGASLPLSTVIWGVQVRRPRAVILVQIIIK